MSLFKISQARRATSLLKGQCACTALHLSYLGHLNLLCLHFFKSKVNITTSYCCRLRHWWLSIILVLSIFQWPKNIQNVVICNSVSVTANSLCIPKGTEQLQPPSLLDPSRWLWILGRLAVPVYREHLSHHTAT